MQHIAGGQVDGLFLAGHSVDALVQLVVLDADHLLAVNLLGRVLAVVFHHLLDFLGAALALAHHTQAALFVEAVLGVEVNQHVEEGLALLGSPGGYLGYHRAGGHSVLVAHKVANHVAIALFAAADEDFLALELANLVADELEARQHIIDLHAHALGNVGGQLAGDDGLDDKLLAGQAAGLFPFFQQIVDQHTHGLVAVEQHPLAIGTLHGHTHAVGVGVAGKDDVGVDVLGQLYGHLHGSLLLGVGAGGCGEIAVGSGLFLHDIDIREAQFLQHARNEGDARAVQRSIDNLQVVVFLYQFGVQGVLLDAVQIDAIDILPYYLDVGFAAAHLHIFETLDFHHLVNHIGVVRGHQLAAVVPVGLVAVVLLGVVAGRHHHTRLAAEVAHGKRKLGSGTQCLEQIYMEAVCGQHIGSNLGKLAAVVAAVVAHSSLDGIGCGEALLHIVGQALGGHSHRVFVHAVGAHAHNAAQTAGAELQAAVETLVQLIRVIHHVADCLLCFLVVLAVQPGHNVFFCRSIDVQILDILHSRVLSIW